MEKLPLNKRIAEAAHISLEQADRAIEATIDGFRCLLHVEEINVGNTPVPHVAEAQSAPAPLAQLRRHCHPRHRGDLVAHIAKEAGIEARAAGTALALVLGQLEAIGREVGVRSVLEYRP
jgi:nucleoid DNA-binding protein